MEPLKLGVVGGGEGATKALLGLAGFELVDLRAVVCQPNELLGSVQSDHRVASVRELLERADVEAVYIATPNITHVPLAARSLEAGKHVLIEKPLAATLEQATELLSKVEGRPLIAAVAFKKRFHPGFLAIQSALPDDLSQVAATVDWITGPPRTEWRYDVRISGGGVAIDLGSHVFDLLEHLFGPVGSLRARLSFCDRAPGIDEYVNVTLTFESGSTAEVRLGWASVGHRQSFRFAAPNFRASFQRRACKDRIEVAIPDHVDLSSHSASSEYRNLFGRFLKSVRSLRSSEIPTLQDGIRNHVLLEWVYRSVSTP